MERLASTDFLTGVPNRGAPHDALVRESGAFSRSGGALSVVLFDLDHFEQVNDALGHKTGDRAARRPGLEEQRQGWEVGRGEFLVLLAEAGPEQALELARRLGQAVRSHRFARVGSLTASFGVPSLRRGESPEALLRRAGDALRRATRRTAGTASRPVALPNGGPALKSLWRGSRAWPGNSAR